MAKLLHESTSTQLVRKGSRWKATLITPGQGSSGTYSEAMLRENAAVFAGLPVKNYFMHPAKPGDQRDPRDQWGYVESESVRYEDGIGIVAEINVLPHWKEVVDSLAAAGQAHLSIFAMGEADEDGNVTSLLPDIKNSVDLVDYPGRPGSGLTEQMLESARAGAPKPAVEASAEEKEAHDMDEKILAAIEALTNSLTPVVAFVTAEKDASQKQSQAEADADAVDKAVEERMTALDEKFTAIDAAEGLSPKQVESLRTAAKNGEDITPLLESAVAVAAEFKTLTESAGASGAGVVTTGGTDTDYSIPNWS